MPSQQNRKMKKLLKKFARRCIKLQNENFEKNNKILELELKINSLKLMFNYLQEVDSLFKDLTI